MLRSPPIPPISRPTTCTLVTTRDPTEPLCSGPVYPAESHSLAMFPTESRIAAISLHLVELASSNSSPICPRHRPPSRESNRPPPHGLLSSSFDKRWSPYRPLFTATLARTIPPIPGHLRYLPASFSVYPPAFPGFPKHSKPPIYRSRPSSLAAPPLTRSKPPTALQPSSTTQPRTTFPTPVHRRSRVDASVYTAFLISTLVRHHGVLFPSSLFF